MTTAEYYSEEHLKKLLIGKINNAYGKDHNIKTAIFKAVSSYDDEYDNYNPILILIDKDYNEVQHKLYVTDLCPSSDEQYDNDSDENIFVDDFTINF